jgi:hypothetical protein
MSEAADDSVTVPSVMDHEVGVNSEPNDGSLRFVGSGDENVNCPVSWQGGGHVPVMAIMGFPV